MSTFARRNRFICGCKSERLWAWRRRIRQSGEKGGATGFCVALLDEAIELREAGVQDPILILSVVDLAYVPLLIQYDLSVTVATQEWLEAALQQLTPESNTPLRVHLKVDTGMGRIGF